MKRTVKEIVEWTRDRWPWDKCSYARLDCGHSVKSGTVGETADCERCDADEAAIDAMLALRDAGKYSHLTERDLTAGKTGEWMAYCCYRRDARSPTACVLHASCSVNPYTTRRLTELKFCAIPGPSRGAMARL